MRSQKHSVTVISNSAGAPVDRRGFTLVELLVVIAIIGILMGIAVPAIFGVIETAKSTKQRLELSQIEQAIERYQEKYGDYPPDFSDWTVVERHYRKIFPRIETAQLQLLQRLLDVNPNSDITPLPLNANAPAHDASRMDRAEALVWTLGGYSNNPLRPFTGDGGPLLLVPGTDGLYQINLDRDNALYEFDTSRLDLEITSKDAPTNAGNYWKSSDSTDARPDPFPHYAASDDGTPFVYFDSRTYFHRDPIKGMNGYLNTVYTDDEDAIRPYLSDRIDESTFAPIAMNPDTFQVIGPGSDNRLGYTTHQGGTYSTNPVDDALYLRYPTGNAYIVIFKFGKLRWGPTDLCNRYQEPVATGSVDHPHQDNLTNFADGKLIDELQE